MLEMVALFAATGSAAYIWLSIVPGAAWSAARAAARCATRLRAARLAVFVLAIGSVIPVAAMVLATVFAPAWALALLADPAVAAGGVAGVSLWCARAAIVGLPHLSAQAEWPLIEAAGSFLPSDASLLPRLEAAYRAHRSRVATTRSSGHSSLQTV